MDLYNKQSRWEEMLEAAHLQAALRVGRSRTVKQKYVDEEDRHMVPDSSSPARPE